MWPCVDAMSLCAVGVDAVYMTKTQNGLLTFIHSFMCFIIRLG